MKELIFTLIGAIMTAADASVRAAHKTRLMEAASAELAGFCFQRRDAFLDRVQGLFHFGSGVSAKDAFAERGLSDVVDACPEIVKSLVDAGESFLELPIHRLDSITDVAEDPQSLIFRLGHGQLLEVPNIGGSTRPQQT